ncbi:glycosyltransferase family 1 protein [Sphingomonas sp. 2R-10]|uniref:glycosyltransferase family 4 protein n=1 Tax=Sphingomonas sp. 2R-10 TaxID=3045148 RepID=UPI000F7ACA7F|nr:glycosyltransferase family 1 protein [Sphingomonas sp. 2R-10]MDJ0278256.1 glycosyltransferase family 1 protein [Sphingomonas sp. 2R-10]
MRIAIVSDAWSPQVNGVVRTLQTTIGRLQQRGHVVETFTPDGFATRPCPGYPEIRLALGCGPELGRRIAAFRPDAIHIATEGPLGWAARAWCRRQGARFTTSFHTNFADYLAMRTHLPAGLFWPFLRRFHAAASGVMTVTARVAASLRDHGIGHTKRWSRGVDLSLFRPDGARLDVATLPRPILLHVGRIAVEKNIEAFLALDTPGTRLLVGDGPARAELERRYPLARFVGLKQGAGLAAAYRAADVLVFPSRTDTFGLVMIEALACGTPVAGYPVPGPLDIVGTDGTGGGAARIGAVDDDLAAAVALALTADRDACVRAGAAYCWSHCTDQFVCNLVDAGLARADTAA